MENETTVNYAFALKHYKQYGAGRSMKKFCDDEGYDYDKFMRYSREGEKALKGDGLTHLLLCNCT